MTFAVIDVVPIREIVCTLKFDALFHIALL